MDNNQNIIDEKKRANLLCIISLICEFGPLVLAILISLILEKFQGITLMEASEVLSGILSILLLACAIAGFVIMIYVRVRYPKSVFGKVLMWLHIIYAICVLVYIIFIIWLVYSCIAMCNSCI